MNTTVFDNVTDPFQIVSGVNQNTNQYLGIILVFAIYFILIIIFTKRYSFKQSTLVAGVITTMVAIISWRLALIGAGQLWMPIVLTIGSILVYMITE